MAGRRREIRWSTAAREDLREIVAFIAADRPLAAEGVLERILGRVSSLAESSKRGRVPPELLRFGIAEYREVVVAPWRVVYERVPQAVEIHAVLDSRRDLEELLLRRLIR